MTAAAVDQLIITKKSTNVRSVISIPGSIRAAISVASRVAPGPTSAVVDRLFRSTRRSAPRPGERDILDGATPSEVAGMRVWSWGEGPTVLLVHGWNGRATQLGDFVEPLVARGYRVVAFDAIGHGESRGKFSSLPELATCIELVADALGEVYGVIAHSLGGAATTFALSRGLRVERAVFISPPSDPREFLSMVSGALGASDEVRLLVKERVERRLGTALEDMRAEMLARSMTTPLLVIHDENDKEVPVGVGRRIARAWPDAELVITQGLGHQRILRAEPVLNRAVSFIDAPRRWKVAA